MHCLDVLSKQCVFIYVLLPLQNSIDCFFFENLTRIQDQVEFLVGGDLLCKKFNKPEYKICNQSKIIVGVSKTPFNCLSTI